MNKLHYKLNKHHKLSNYAKKHKTMEKCLPYSSLPKGFHLESLFKKDIYTKEMSYLKNYAQKHRKHTLINKKTPDHVLQNYSGNITYLSSSDIIFNFHKSLFNKIFTKLSTDRLMAYNITAHLFSIN